MPAGQVNKMGTSNESNSPSEGAAGNRRESPARYGFTDDGETIPIGAIISDSVLINYLKVPRSLQLTLKVVPHPLLHTRQRQPRFPPRVSHPVFLGISSLWDNVYVGKELSSST